MERPLQILLAEDNQGDIFLIAEALSNHRVKHRLHVVRDGEAALQFFEKMGDAGIPRPDLLMLDLNLPKVEGDVVLENFRGRPDCRRTPVIVVTSSDAPRDRERVSRLGISGYFRKPSDLAEFMRLGEVVKGVVQECAIQAPSGA
jgi:CheY-like chemotaxis protein